MAGLKLHCEVVSPERVVYQGEADMVVVRGVEGEIGILPTHVPIITSLGIGEMRIKRDGSTEYIAVMGGYLEFSYDRVTVLADLAEHCAEIDTERAKRKKEERERQLTAGGGEEEEVAVEAQESLQKAITRLKVAEKRNR